MNSAKQFQISLQDSTGWIFSFADETSEWGEKLARIMRLPERRSACPSRLKFSAAGCRIAEHALLLNYGGVKLYRQASASDLLCTVDTNDDDESTAIVNMWHALSPIYLQSMERGGLPFHAALVERNGQGVLLAAPGDTGKSTCARRIPSPWKALCDDETLIVRDPEGQYWAHPFPTWSDYLWKRAANTWDVQAAVPLSAIFFFEQSQTDWVEALGQGQAAVHITDSANQTCRRIWMRQKDRQVQIKTQIFHNACQLAQRVPAFRMGISLRGQFWKEIERALAGTTTD